MPLISELFSSGRDRYNFTVLAMFLLVLLFFGGASRVDVLGQAVVRIAAVIVLVSGTMQFDRTVFREARAPLIFLAILAAIIAVQLVPLPPGLWNSLPGRSVYAESLASIGADQVWRPASVTPDRTLNALLAMLPPAAVVVTCALLSSRSQAQVLILVLVAIAISTLLGVLQVASGGPYLYSITNRGSAVGAFANRNHAALFLAISLPLLAAWVSLGGGERHRPGIRTWVALSVSIAVFPVLLVIGSRGGLLLGGLAFFSALLVESGSMGRASRRVRLLLLSSVALIGLAAIAIFVIFSRAEAIQRFSTEDRPELRSDLLPLLFRMAGDYFPVGSGFGSFEYVYRMYEPHAFLGPAYLNQAHNDPAQIVIEGGLPALLLVLGFVAWFWWRALKVWKLQRSPSVILGRTASIGIALMAISSCFDYPLRTPLMAMTASIMLVWLAGSRVDREAAPRAPGSLGKPVRLS